MTYITLKESLFGKTLSLKSEKYHSAKKEGIWENTMIWSNNCNTSPPAALNFHYLIVKYISSLNFSLKRTIKLLCWIGAIFCICWLPLNLWNAVLDATRLDKTISGKKICFFPNEQLFSQLFSLQMKYFVQCMLFATFLGCQVLVPTLSSMASSMKIFQRNSDWLANGGGVAS